MLAVDAILGIYYFGPFCITPVIWFMLFFAFRKRIRPLFLILVFIVTPLAVISILRATDEPAMELAASLAVAPIQDAIDQQCGTSGFTAKPEGFDWSLDFGYRYRDGQAICRYQDATSSWICEC